MEGISAQEALEGAGLTNIEAKVYLELLQLGSSTAGPIIKSLGLHRATVYTVLQRLMEKGLVSYIMREGKRRFSATDPENILDDIKEREERIKDVLPQLKERQKRSEEKRVATMYEGNKAVRSMFEEALKRQKPGDEQLVFGTQNITDYFNKFFKSYERRRASKGVNQKIAINEMDQEWINSSKNLPKTEIKTIPKEFTSPAEFDILGDTLAIVLWGKNPLAFAIDNKEVADSFRSYFNLLWNQDVQVSRGIEGVQGAWNRMLDELRRGEEYYALGASWRGQKEKVYDYFIDFHKRRYNKGVKAKLLFVSGTEHLVEKYKDNYKRLAEVKFLPSGIYKGIQINLYKGKTLLFVWREKEPVVFTIDDKRIYQTFKTYFDTLWNQDITVSRGFKAFETAWMSLFDELGENDSYDVFGAAFGTKGNQDKFVKFFRNLHMKRIQKGIPGRILFQQGAEKVVEDYKMGDLYSKGLEFKFLPYRSEFPVEIFTHDDKTLMLIQKKEPTIITINNKEITKAFKNHFETLWSQETRVVRGLDAIQGLFEEMLEAGSCDLIGARGYFVDARPRYIDGWEKRAIKTGFKIRNIVDIETKGHRNTKWPFAETKYTIPKEFSKLSVFWIYGNKVAISNWTEKEPIAVVIENRHLHDMYKEQFEVLWSQNTSTYSGIGNIRQLFNDVVLSMKSGDYWDIFTVGKNPEHINQFFRDMHKKRSNKGIKARLILSEDIRKEARLRGRIPLTACRLLPKSFAAPVVVNICGNTTILNFWTTEKEPIAYKIEDKKTAGLYREYFRALWNMAKD